MLKVLSKLKKHDIDVKAKIDDVKASVGALPALLDGKFAVTNGKVDTVNTNVMDFSSNFDRILAATNIKLEELASSLATVQSNTRHQTNIKCVTGQTSKAGESERVVLDVVGKGCLLQYSFLLDGESYTRIMVDGVEYKFRMLNLITKDLVFGVRGDTVDYQSWAVCSSYITSFSNISPLQGSTSYGYKLWDNNDASLSDMKNLQNLYTYNGLPFNKRLTIYITNGYPSSSSHGYKLSDIVYSLDE